MTIAPPSMFFAQRNSHLPIPRITVDFPVMDLGFPPTPAPSLPSPSGTSRMEQFEPKVIFPKSGRSTSPYAPPSGPLPPTPPADDPTDLKRLSIRDEMVPQRIRRGRTPVFDPDGFKGNLSEAHQIDTSSGESSQSSRQRLDVDLDAYSTESDEGREPTLSFHTSSTVESTTGTPSSMHGAYGFSHEGGEKAGVEPRIRVRHGRSTAYSSAESSGAYSYHQYENHVFHPHPPPLPDRPHPFADPLGLGIRDGENPNVQLPDVNPDFSYRPWEAESVNRVRSTSGTSLASYTSSHGGASSLQHYDYHYPDMLPWDTQRLLENEPEAVVMVEEGRERTLDMAKLQEMGGIAQMNERKIARLSGEQFLG
jgi:hypothetical protein